MQDNDQTDTAVEKDGVQYVSSTLRSGRYPDITVKAGEPVKWEIQVPEGSINGCNYKMILQDFGMDHTLEKMSSNLYRKKKASIRIAAGWA